MTKLSTHTMVKAVQVSDNWSEQVSMLEELKGRSDLFNLEPVLELAVDDRQHFTVRRATVECAATHNSHLTLEWLRAKAENRFSPAGQRKLALQGLATLQIPHKTLPLLEEAASNSGPLEVRVEAVRLIGKFRNLRSVGLLTLLARNRDEAIAEAAQNALEHIVEKHGGRRAVVNNMVERAEDLQLQGKRSQAREVLLAASRLEPYNGQLLYRMARLAVA